MKHLKTLVAASAVALIANTSSAWEKSIVAETQAAHGLEAWWGKEVVKLEAKMLFGGNKVVDGEFTFEAHGPKARYDRADGVSIIFDGKTAWVSPAEAEAPMGRFHVLTWPWFVMAPFKMVGDGITLSEHSVREIDGVPHYTMKQTFGSDMGDAPDDWYRFFINKDTKRIDAMSYIVTYGTDLEQANKQPSIIRYLDYRNAEGPILSSEYEFWYWNPNTNSYVGDEPKGFGSIRNVRYMSLEKADFIIPEGAKELTLPATK